MGATARAFENRATFFTPSLATLSALDAAPANDTGGKPASKEVAEFKWIHCATEGRYEGHHQGAFDLTRAVFESFVRNLRADPQYQSGELKLADGQTYTGGVRPVIQFDYEHASEMPPWEGSIAQSGAPAPAWVLDVELREGPGGKAQLWAFGKLGSQIRLQIGDDGYRSVSIAFTLEGVHWITGAPIGPVLTSIAFTNHPFMRDLEPLAAANRRTSAPLGQSVKPEGQSTSVAPAVASGAPAPSHEGVTMSDQAAAQAVQLLRDRVCRALKVRTLATDEEVSTAAEEAAAGSSDLQLLLTALDVTASSDAMKAVAELRSGRDRLAKALAELNAILQQDAAADATVAPTEVGAAMSAAKMTGDGAKKALLAYRESLINEELKKLGGEPTISLQRAARAKGRERFLSEYGVKPEHAHLGLSIVAGPNGTQFETPKTLTIDERQTDDAQVIDLKAFKGPNVTARLLGYLRKNEAGFDRLSPVAQFERVSEVRRSAQLTGT